MVGNIRNFIDARGLLLPLLVWVVSVVAFAVIYWLLWSASSDAFILNKELNLRPLDTLRGLYFDDEMPLNDALQASTGDDLAESNGKVARLVADVKQQRAKLQALTQQEATAQRSLHDASIKLDEERIKQIQAFTKEKTKDELAMVGKTVAVVAQHETAAAAARRVQDFQRASQETKLAADAIRVAGEAKIVLAEKHASVAGYALNHFGEFGTNASKEALVNADTERQKVLEAQIEVDKQRFNTRQSTSALWQAVWADRRGRLGFIDFLYFSAGMSTSNSFGDITANSHAARAWVIAQILISVMIVAWFLNCLFERKRAAG